MRKALLPLLFLFIASSVFANQFISGYINYQYLGMADSATEKFIISLTLNRDCYASQTPFFNKYDIGVYQNTVNATRIKKVTLSQTIESEIQPLPTPNISVPYCSRKHVYTDTVLLPINPNGYQLFFSFRASNTTTAAIHTVIPPNYATNTPPANNLPVYHAMASAETAVFDVSTTDADGDSLTYSLLLQQHKQGYYASNLLPYRLDPNSDLAEGNTSLIPILIGGQAQINPQTGKLYIYATNPDRYLLSIEITEWRNGIAIAKYRQPFVLQVIIKNLPTNGFVSITGRKKNEITMLSWVHSLTAIKQFYVERKLPQTFWQRIDSTINQNANDNSRFDDTVLRRYRVVAVGEKNKKPVTVISDEWTIGGNFTAINELALAALTVYPNPTTDWLTITSPQDFSPQKIEITDILGKKVYTNNFSPQIHVQHLPNGFYNLHVFNSKTLLIAHFIKQ